MAGRATILCCDEYYHVYNRGIDRQPVFLGKRDYERFLLTLSYYRFLSPPVKLSRLLQLSQEERSRVLEALTKKGKKLVEVVCFALMPNHFHLLLKQLTDKGISTFLSKSVNSYTRYFNTKQERAGDLFQGVFKAVHIETNEQLLHLSRYIHLNPLVSFVIKEANLSSYPWSSFPHYLKGESGFVTLELVLTHFSSPKNYQQFVLDQADYAKKLERIKHLVME